MYKNWTYILVAVILYLTIRLTHIYMYYATYNNKKAIISANSPVASEKAKPKIA